MGVKKNFIYSSILTISGYLFPLLTFPYVTRVLGVDNIGKCNFYDSIISYFILFSMLGMMNLGIREIAKCNGDSDKLSRTFSSLLGLNGLSTALACIVLVVLSFTVIKFRECPQMIYIGFSKVLANFLLIEWFYRGIEQFKYITIRTIAVRILYVIVVFLLIRRPEHYIRYFFLTCMTFVVNAIINIAYSRKYVSFSFRNINLKKYIKPFVTLGSYQILTSMYTTLNVVILGFMTNDVQVGYYSTAIKLYTIIISLYTAFTSVMMPRMSSLLNIGEMKGAKVLVSKSFNLLYCFSIPMIMLTVAFAPSIIHILAGEGFQGAVSPMRIVMPLMLIIGIEQILIYQILMPLNQDKSVLINSVIGACAGLILNIILVRKFECEGSAMAWIGSELAVFSSALFFTHKFIDIKNEVTNILKRILITIPSAMAVIIVLMVGNQSFMTFLIVSVLVFGYQAIAEVFILRSNISQEIISVISRVLRCREV